MTSSVTPPRIPVYTIREPSGEIATLTPDGSTVNGSVEGAVSSNRAAIGAATGPRETVTSTATAPPAAIPRTAAAAAIHQRPDGAASAGAAASGRAPAS